MDDRLKKAAAKKKPRDIVAGLFSLLFDSRMKPARTRVDASESNELPVRWNRTPDSL